MSKRSGRADVIDEAEAWLLRAAGLDDREPAFTAWDRFRGTVPENQESLAQRRLLPLVYRNLLRLGHEKDAFLAHAYAESLGANARLLDETGHALRTLSDAGIPTMVLKGTALLLAHYRDVGSRPMSDADLLVPEARITEALDVLEAAGWRGDPARGWLQTGIHAGTLLSASDAILDLHRHALYDARFNSADEGFFERAVPLELSGIPTRAMSPEDQLLHTIVHGLRWSVAPSAIWTLDAATVLKRNRVNAERTVTQARALRLELPLREGLRIVRTLFGELDGLTGFDHEARDAWSVMDRIEHHFRVRNPDGFMGALPNLWFTHRRGAPESEASPSGFSDFLAKSWDVSPANLPSLLARKAWRRLRRGFFSS
jgi:hypothetical protein